MSDTASGFNHRDPEIVALMHAKAEEQTARIVEADERLQRGPNFDRFRMLAVSRVADPTSILDDEDDYARIRPAFPPAVASPTGTRIGFYVNAPVRRPSPGYISVNFTLTAADVKTIRAAFGFPDPPATDPVPGSFAAAMQEFAAAMAKTIEQIKTVLVDVGHNFSDLQKRIADLGVLDDGDTNRLRHGAAATCPRHGPTKGGLCRKCNR